MGNIIKASCLCGLESEDIYHGIGFRFYETGTRVEPAFCDACGIVVGRDINKSYSKCPKCRKKVKFYRDEIEERVVEEELGLSTGDYLEDKEFWHCPKCKREKLQFESMGLWD